MRIDTNKKVIYYANPKTGSTSLRQVMDKHQDFSLINHLKDNNKFHDHWSFQFRPVLADEFSIDIKDYFSFTTIRNPWDRVVSAFKYSKCDKNGNAWYTPNYDKNTAGQYTFSEFVRDIHDKDYWCGIGIPNAQHFCFDENNKQIMTKIYNIETLTKDIIKNDIKKHVNIDYDVSKIPYLNITKSIDYRSFYTEKWMIDVVKDVFKKDIEIGNYVF